MKVKLTAEELKVSSIAPIKQVIWLTAFDEATQSHRFTHNHQRYGCRPTGVLQEAVLF